MWFVGVGGAGDVGVTLSYLILHYYTVLLINACVYLRQHDNINTYNSNNINSKRIYNGKIFRTGSIR